LAEAAWELVTLELGNLKSVRACADALLKKGEPFDVVIANAGVMATPLGHTADGFETQFGTNHLGHFVLVNRIAPLIPGRLINVSSAGHRYSNVDLEDPNFQGTPYDPFVAYGVRRRRTFFSRWLSTGGIADGAYGQRRCIRGSSRPN
jgi:NAD(P)-dependent dehydrogenase (short-subunit alcohol dehydrogenase family)